MISVAIEKIFKLKFFLKFTAVIVASIILMVSALYLFLPKPDISHYASVVTSFIMADDMLMPVFIIAEVIEFLFITLIVVLISVFASHKIAGPLYRMEKSIECLSNIKIEGKMRFRDYDQLQNIPPVFNDVCNGLRERISAVSSAYEKLEQARKEVDGTASSMERLKEKVDMLGKEIKRFNL